MVQIYNARHRPLKQPAPVVFIPDKKPPQQPAAPTPPKQPYMIYKAQPVTPDVIAYLTGLATARVAAQDLPGDATRILRIVSDVTCVPIPTLKGPRRAFEFSRPRQLFMYLARKHCGGTSFPAIGALINKDHSTIMHGCKHIDEILYSPRMAELRGWLWRCEMQIYNDKQRAAEEQ